MLVICVDVFGVRDWLLLLCPVMLLCWWCFGLPLLLLLCVLLCCLCVCFVCMFSCIRMIKLAMFVVCCCLCVFFAIAMFVVLFVFCCV